MLRLSLHKRLRKDNQLISLIQEEMVEKSMTKYVCRNVLKKCHGIAGLPFCLSALTVCCRYRWLRGTQCLAAVVLKLSDKLLKR